MVFKRSEINVTPCRLLRMAQSIDDYMQIITSGHHYAIPAVADPALEAATADTDIDEESFRSDLERDSAHSSLVNGQMSAAVNGEASRRRSKPISEHEARYEQLLMQGTTDVLLS